MKRIKQVVSFIFFGNVFYALCTVALCLETAVVAGLPFNSILFYIVVAAATLCFYGLVYYLSGLKINPQLIGFDWQSRVLWYASHRKLIAALLWIGALTILIGTIMYVASYQSNLESLSAKHYAALVFFPVLSVAYSFNVLPFSRFKVLRSAGVLKPFILGFAWAGFVTVFPLIALRFEGKLNDPHQLAAEWMFVQNFIFISLLCILFDIKDVDDDKRRNLRTIPVRIGVHNTIFFVVVPLVVIDVVMKFFYFQHLPAFYAAVAIRTVPYIFLLAIALQVKRPKSTLFYLAAVDGLMLLKAVAGIISIIILK